MKNLNTKTVPGQKSLRSACDLCHEGKIKCSGGRPCDGCHRLDVKCTYSTSNRTGRPKGVKNKKTLDRIRQLRAADSDAQGEQQPIAEGDMSATSRRASVVQTSSNTSSEQLSPLTPLSLPGPVCDSEDPNFQPWAHGNPSHFWDFFPLSESAQSPSKPNNANLLYKSRANEPRGSPSSIMHTSHNSADDMWPDLFWVTSMLNTPDLMTPRPESADHSPENTARGGSSGSYAPLTHPTPSSAVSSLPQTNSASACNCVLQLTEQLSTLKALSRSQNQLRPDFILTIARYALAGWQSHLECPTCQFSDDKDILVLSVMALRALLNLFQDMSQHESPSPPDMASVEHILLNTPPSALNIEQSFLGIYRLACEEKRMVFDLLLQKTLQNLNQTIKHLRQKSLRMVGTSPRRNTLTSSRSDRSLSLPALDTSICSSFPDSLPMNAMTDDMNSSTDTVPLDEHDNYLQESLQNSAATIESLLTQIQAPDMDHYLDNAQIFASRQ